MTIISTIHKSPLLILAKYMEHIIIDINLSYYKNIFYSNSKAKIYNMTLPDRTGYSEMHAFNILGSLVGKKQQTLYSSESLALQNTIQ